jgi:hypothetical protein
MSAQATPIPDGSWAVIMANASGAELVSIGHIAESTYHRGEAAAQAWR